MQSLDPKEGVKELFKYAAKKKKKKEGKNVKRDMHV